MSILGKRILGRLNQFPVASSGGGGGGVTIQNNVDGRLLKATGGSSTISGISQLTFDGSELDVSTDLYIQGSGNNLFLDGTDQTGTTKKYRIEIVGGVLSVVPT